MTAPLRRLTAIAAAGPLLFIAITVVAGAVKPGYDIRKQTVSDLAVGAYGWIQTANFFVLGGATAALALALAIAGKPRRRTWVAVVLLAAAGIGIAAEALFPTDLAGAPETPDGVAHNMIFLLVFVALIAASALLGAKLVAASTFVGVAVFVMFAGDLGDPLHEVAGLLERGVIAIPLLWITVTALRLAPRRLPRGRRAAPVVATALLVVLGLSIAPQADAQTRTLHVNPATGADTSAGSSTAPLKTLGRALKLASSGTTIELAPGVFGPGFSGDTFPAGGLRVPPGVTIQGAQDGSGFPVSTLLGPGKGVALNFAGNATVRNLGLGGAGFGVGLYAKQGAQTLRNLLIIHAPGPGEVDGIAFNSAVLPRKTARTTLIGSTIFLPSNGTAVSVNEQARFVMDGGTITAAGGANCRVFASGVDVNHSSQATVKNVFVQNLAGTGFAARDQSKVTLSNSRIQRHLPAGCRAVPSVAMTRQAALTLRGVETLTNNSAGEPATELEADNGFAGTLTLADTKLFVAKGTALAARGPGRVAIAGSSVTSGAGAGVQARETELTVTDSTLEGRGAAAVQADALVLRDSSIKSDRAGIEVTGVGADLGAPTDPGGNDFRGAVGPIVTVSKHIDNTLILAVGNTWHANEQGSDVGGHYFTPRVVNGTSPGNKGRNFDLAPIGQDPDIQLVLAAIGQARVTPRVVRARAGRIARLAVSWTHPEGWRNLRSIRALLHRGGTHVGTIAVRGERVSARGAVRLVGARVRHRGRTLTARLRVRLARRLAGTRLRVAVRAVDRTGHRQTVPAAGKIRVLR